MHTNPSYMCHKLSNECRHTKQENILKTSLYVLTLSCSIYTQNSIKKTAQKYKKKKLVYDQQTISSISINHSFRHRELNSQPPVNFPMHLYPALGLVSPKVGSALLFRCESPKCCSHSVLDPVLKFPTPEFRANMALGWDCLCCTHSFSWVL